MNRLRTALLTALALAAGCEPSGRVEPARTDAPEASDAPATLRVDPLPVQQAKAYPETATGIFISLADFEDVPGGAKGYTQVAHFSVRPDAPGGQRRFVVNITRTGVGGIEADLPPGSELVFALPHAHDFTEYKLLSVAVYSRALRDDLCVRLLTDGASWRSHRTLLRPGWNNVLVDIQHLSKVKGFDATSVRSIRLGCADAAGPVRLNVDDIMLVDNTRTIRPTPPGIVLRKSGLDYALSLPGRPEPIALAQDADGLWRLAALGAQVRLAGPGEVLPGNGEHLALMGPRRVGLVELLEHNGLRVRLANTWYFPTRAGQWASLAVRRIRWEHTIYRGGRMVTSGLLNNAGGQEIASAQLRLPCPGAWSGGGLSDRFSLADFAGAVGRWNVLVSPPGAAGKAMAQNYLRPGRLREGIVARDVFAPGDADHDRFDESQGCFFLGAKAGHCRFTVLPPAEGLWDPVFLVSGPWAGKVHVSSEGLAVEQTVRRMDGAVLFMLPGCLRRPTAMEVTGRPALVAGANRPGGYFRAGATFPASPCVRSPRTAMNASRISGLEGGVPKPFYSIKMGEWMADTPFGLAARAIHNGPCGPLGP